jgi:hypothetical protein
VRGAREGEGERPGAHYIRVCLAQGLREGDDGDDACFARFLCTEVLLRSVLPFPGMVDKVEVTEQTRHFKPGV